MRKYAIKEDDTVQGFRPSYIVIGERFSSNPGYGFDYTDILADATQFSSVTEAVDAVLLRQQHRLSGLSEKPKKFTVVGIEEVYSNPTFKEIAL